MISPLDSTSVEAKSVPEQLADASILEGGPGIFEGGPGFVEASPIALEATPIGDPFLVRKGVPIITQTGFPPGGWDPVLKAWAIASSFAARTQWISECDPGPPDDSKEALALEIQALLRWIELGKIGSVRSKRRNEIAAQAADVTPYWMNVLATSPSSRPATFDLVKIGIHVGGIIASYFKLKYMRARPVQVCAQVMPALMTPPHPSYPNGHALQAFMVAKCAGAAAPAMDATCRALADRIAENREVAGIHFPSDTEASRRIAGKAFDLLASIAEFKTVFQEAQNEWTGAKSDPLPKTGGEEHVRS